MRIATWNLNSVKARLPRLLSWLADRQPDVLLVQETKATEQSWPAAEVQALGYESAHLGNGRWNGVAILSRVGLADVTRGLPGQPAFDGAVEDRAIGATCAGVRLWSLYVPNGRTVGPPALRLQAAVPGRRPRPSVAERAALGTGTPYGLLGDFNVAPNDNDVWDIAAFDGSTHVSAPERAALAAIEQADPHAPLVDLKPRASIDPDDTRPPYTFWEMRMLGFQKGRGMRIDLALVNDPLAQRVRSAWVDRDARRGEGPSDHAPLVLDLADADLGYLSGPLPAFHPDLAEPAVQVAHGGPGLVARPDRGPRRVQQDRRVHPEQGAQPVGLGRAGRREGHRRGQQRAAAGELPDGVGVLGRQPDRGVLLPRRPHDPAQPRDERRRRGDAGRQVDVQQPGEIDPGRELAEDLQRRQRGGQLVAAQPDHGHVARLDPLVRRAGEQLRQPTPRDRPVTVSHNPPRPTAPCTRSSSRGTAACGRRTTRTFLPSPAAREASWPDRSRSTTPVPRAAASWATLSTSRARSSAWPSTAYTGLLPARSDACGSKHTRWPSRVAPIWQPESSPSSSRPVAPPELAGASAADSAAVARIRLSAATSASGSATRSVRCLLDRRAGGLRGRRAARRSPVSGSSSGRPPRSRPPRPGTAPG